MKVREVTLRRVDVPLDRPYPLSFNQVDMASFDAIVAEVRDGDGRTWVGRSDDPARLHARNRRKRLGFRAWNTREPLLAWTRPKRNVT